jgi:DNA-directed RNA polymerase specialized sigma24 family protein
VLRLPEKYRVVVLLRDLEQLSTEEAANCIGSQHCCSEGTIAAWPLNSLFENDHG